MSSTREFTNTPKPLGVDEEVAYWIDTLPWGGTPTSVTVKVYDITAGIYTDVTSTVMPSGSASVVGNVINLPIMKAVTAEHIYRLEVKFTSAGNKVECWGLIFGEL
jgi:hypothetical protein